ncbi:putative nuclease HARBI1 [Bacillus rossius redtenbacheri]|uniref:putative nuclease HARBI1 n=1 Tax=Bacillus rossius redtenbacheri TaxID=93214 RepID=UPI002FDEDEF9
MTGTVDLQCTFEVQYNFNELCLYNFNSFLKFAYALIISRNHPTSPLQQLLIALRFYATGCFLIVAGDFGGVSTSTACRIVKRVSSAIANLKPQVIKFPEGAEEIEQVHRDFYEIAQFPKVIGTIDCTHVKIFSPGGDDAEIFRNRKGYFSINVQTISDARLKVRDVVARWPGSTHDTAIFHNSHRRALFEIGQYGDAFLLGDSGYPLKNYLLTPFLNPRTNGEVTFNERHVRTRSTVERQYGVLKRRFPVLAVGMRVSVDTVMAVIVACCVLHNMCVENNEELPPHEGVPAELELAIANGQVPINIHEVDNQYGNTRAFLANNYFNNL